MFCMKKLVSQFLYPLPWSSLILVAGLLLVLYSRRQKLGKSLIVIGLILLFGFSFVPLSDQLLYPLERPFTPLFTSHRPTTQKMAAIQWIVVLAGGHGAAPHLPATSQLSPAALARVVEGVRMHRHLPHSKLVFSGGGVAEGVSNGAVMAAAARELGVAPQHIVVGSLARDTHEEAVALRHVVGAGPFVLVTSASHMSRSMALFRKVGLHPIASPGDYKMRSAGKKHVRLGHFSPQPHALNDSTAAMHEYLGMLWSKLINQI
jgi:uncharacterized SAM-binding protein YcdF (DUF218 family)